MITGGARFLDSNFEENLLKKGESVHILDNFSTGKLENLPAPSSLLEVTEVNIRDMDVCRMAQTLGAGAFVKKPYVRERIGLAVRKELDRKIDVGIFTSTNGNPHHKSELTIVDS